MRRHLVARAELALICAMAAGFLLILQPWNFPCYRVGLILLLGAAILNMAVGNLPRQATPLRALLLTAAILAITAAIFAAGIMLVPVFAQMGQSE